MKLLDKPLLKRDFIKIDENNVSNNVVNKELYELEERAAVLRDRLLMHLHENPRKPSVLHKSIRKELREVERKINKLKRSLKKFSAIQKALDVLGDKHGKIVLHGREYYW